MTLDVCLETVEYFLKKDVPEVKVRRMYPDLLRFGEDSYYLQISSESTTLGYAVSEIHTGSWSEPGLRIRVHESVMKPHQRRIWEKVEEAYGDAFIYNILES